MDVDVARGLATRWAKDFDRGRPLPEHPRPALERPDWASLNGPWDYAIRPAAGSFASRGLSDFPAGEAVPVSWDGKIVVPYAPECALSGVGRALSPDETLWYRRTVDVPASWAGRRIALRFEAVDYAAAVCVGGRFLGVHRGGYLPFAFDLPAGSAGSEVEIVVAARDPTDAGMQQRGKQALKPAGLLYAATSGIWQSVWLEPLPTAAAIGAVRAEALPGLVGAVVTVELEASGGEAGAGIEVEVEVDLGDGRSAVVRGRPGEALRVDLPGARPWTPREPRLYPVVARTYAGALADEARSYLALRTVDLGPRPGAAGGANGAAPVLRLNGEPFFLNGVLDQGYWPESGMTPPSDAALEFDVVSMKELGFNCLRKHVKVESRRYYWHADRLGMLVVQDAPSGGVNRAGGKARVAAAMLLGRSAEDRSARAAAAAGRADAANRAEFEAELRGMVGLLRFHPCIVAWTVFNESWGQFESERMEAVVRAVDPTRPVDAVSGWYDRGGGDFRSRHMYIFAMRRAGRRDRRCYLVSEYGGYNLAVPGRTWKPDERFGYRFYADADSLARAYAALMRGQVLPLVRRGLGGAVYTQLSDVEIETNGLFTYDREVLKIPAETIRGLNGEIERAFDEPPLSR